MTKTDAGSPIEIVRIARDIIETLARRRAAPSIRRRSRLESAKWNPLDPRARVRDYFTRWRVIVIVARDSAVSPDLCPSEKRSAIRGAANPHVRYGIDICPFGGTRTMRYSNSPFPLCIPFLATIRAGMNALPFDAGSKKPLQVHCLARYCSVLHAHFDRRPSIRELRWQADHMAPDAGRALIWINADRFAVRCMRIQDRYSRNTPEIRPRRTRFRRANHTQRMHNCIYGFIFPRYPRSVLCNHRDVDSHRL
ncbi:hypothetical protein [Lysobacter hankyongensis]|uniref:hypothetical protein n=1 Tax=Lysobacter hankyongensis TaxID=1176535 RepID=UPI0031EA58CE